MNKYFEVSKLDSISVVNLLSSELPIAEINDMRKAFYGLISSSDNKFIINLKSCAFISSIILGILVNFGKKALEEQGRTVYCCLKEEVATVFRITKLDKAFEIYETEEDAIASFAQA